MILVTAATGMFGSGIVTALSEAGVGCRALAHSAESAERMTLPGVEPVVGDLDDPDSLRDAFEGVGTLFLNAPMDERKQQRLTNAIDVAATGSRPRVVTLTGGVQHDDPLGEMGAAAQRHLEASGLAWTAVAPQTVMESNFLPQAEAIGAGAIYGCAGQGRVGFVALDDVTEAAAVLLRRDGGDETSHVITGPRAITFAEAAEAATRALGHDVAYVDMPEADYRKLLVEQAGIPEEVVDIAVIWHLRAMREGKASHVGDDFERLTGRKPRSIEAFFRDHADRFS